MRAASARRGLRLGTTRRCGICWRGRWWVDTKAQAGADAASAASAFKRATTICALIVPTTEFEPARVVHELMERNVADRAALDKADRRAASKPAIIAALALPCSKDTG